MNYKIIFLSLIVSLESYAQSYSSGDSSAEVTSQCDFENENSQTIGQFLKLNENIKSANGGSASFADINGDGFLDFFLTGYNLNNDEDDFDHALFYLNNGKKKFNQSSFDGIQRVIYSNQSFSDFDNDGDIDFILSGTTSGFAEDNVAKLYINNGQGVFTSNISSFPKIYRWTHIEWIDFNNDGNKDLYLQGLNDENQLVRDLYRNEGDQVFVKTNFDFHSSSGGTNPKTAKWADLNNDGFKDLIISQIFDGSDFMTLYINNEGQSFTISDTFNIPYDDYKTIKTSDINNDGLIDILVWKYQNTSRLDMPLILYKNKGNGVFEEIFRENISHFEGSADLVDMNNDGLRDIFVYSHDYGSAKIYINNNSTNFCGISITNFPKTVFDGKLFPGDIDNDGDIDVAVIGSTTGSASDSFSEIYENDLNIQNTRPIPPSDITISLLDKGKILIDWNSGFDNETNSRGLSYNIRIGTEENKGDICSTNSLESGNPLVFQQGLTNNTFYILKKDDFTSYEDLYISVQSIDSGNMHSEFYSKTFSVDETLGIEPLNKIVSTDKNILVYPNPVVNDLYLSGINLDEIKYFKVYDIYGRIVFSDLISNNYNILNNSISLASLESGIYYFILEYSNIKRTFKIIKK